jgi:hypothetical protein
MSSRGGYPDHPTLVVEIDGEQHALQQDVDERRDALLQQFPIPPATDIQRSNVAARARALQTVHSRRRDIVSDLNKRLSAVRRRNRTETWLFPMLKSKKDLADEAPSKLDDDARKQWVEKEFDQALTAHYDEIPPPSGQAASKMAP